MAPWGCSASWPRLQWGEFLSVMALAASFLSLFSLLVVVCFNNSRQWREEAQGRLLLKRLGLLLWFLTHKSSMKVFFTSVCISLPKNLGRNPAGVEGRQLVWSLLYVEFLFSFTGYFSSLHKLPCPLSLPPIAHSFTFHLDRSQQARQTWPSQWVWILRISLPLRAVTWETRYLYH